MKENLAVFGMMAKPSSGTWTDHNLPKHCPRLLHFLGLYFPASHAESPAQDFFLECGCQQVPPVRALPPMSGCPGPHLQPGCVAEAFAESVPRPRTVQGTSSVLFGRSWWEPVFHGEARSFGLAAFVCLLRIFFNDACSLEFVFFSVNDWEPSCQH